MKLLFWNAYHGFTKSKRHMSDPTTRRNGFAQHLALKDPDIAIVLEMTEFTDESLAEFASQWNHSHYALTPGRFPFAVTSKLFIRRPWFQSGVMAHGFFMVTIGNLRLVISHIPPSEYTDRAAELRELLSPLIHLLNENQPFLFLADINCNRDAPLFGALKAIGLNPLGNWDGVNHAFASPSLAHHVIDAQQDKSEQISKLSDHAPLLITLDIKPQDEAIL